jgi:hypothetical protein
MVDQGVLALIALKDFICGIIVIRSGRLFLVHQFFKEKVKYIINLLVFIGL